MYVIRKQFTFSAAHHLLNLPPDHPCSRPHGHNYIVELILEGKLRTECWVRDYRELDIFKKWIDAEVDHRDLNEVFSGMQTTAENLAYKFWEKARYVFMITECTGVSVSETPKTWATYFHSKED